MTTLTPAATTVSLPTRASRAVHAEWTKLRSVRSHVAALVATPILLVLLGAAMASMTVAAWDALAPEMRADFEPVASSLSGIDLAQLVLGTLGVLLVTGEYGSGTIRATFAAVPQRPLLLGSKAAVFAVAAFVVSAVGCLAAFLIAQPILAEQDLNVGLGDPGVLRAVLGSALYLTVAGLLGIGLAAILRHTAAAIGTLFAVLFALPLLAHFLPATISDRVVRYLPTNAGGAIAQLNPGPTDLAPWTGFALFCAYAAATLFVGAVLANRRDV
ncbi:ABC transporter permease subunit [Rhodococcus sp. Z13]|uniref:ABC transporter permease subunit n=1 Tax=Rhodococcus sacchari TaxID=2962047 RepID=A0ACD4DEX4_9NOCA|nr:ABC transporter permease [Rhodococcus sp. Z13]UYP18630.1 ABC transporter permease subunit [Rhodococcus sp. Z13]